MSDLPHYFRQSSYLRIKLEFFHLVVSSVDHKGLTSQHKSSVGIEKYVYNVLYIEVSILLSKLTYNPLVDIAISISKLFNTQNIPISPLNPK